MNDFLAWFDNIFFFSPVMTMLLDDVSGGMKNSSEF